MEGEPHTAGTVWPIGWGMERKRDGKLRACPILYRNEERTMTRKDYVLIAEAISGAVKAHGETGCVRLAAENLAHLLRRDNPRFERARFMEACGFPHYL